jgi:putative nucleotidyltransferase with HDIG domain
MMQTQWKPAHPAFEMLLAAMLDEAEPIYVVGGVVRDHLLGKRGKITDLDLAVFENAIPLARRVADQLGWAFYAMDEGHDVGRLIFVQTGGEPLVCDVASMHGRGLESDLESRDFTINAMAFELRHGANTGEVEARLIDTVGGQQDLASGLIRRASPISLVADPVRLLRAVRFAVQLSMQIEEATDEQIERVSDTVRLVSPERVRDELCKMLNTENNADAMQLASDLALLRHVLPEVEETRNVAQTAPHYLDVYAHTLETMRRITAIRRWIMSEKEDSAETVDEVARVWQAALEPWRAYLRRHFIHSLSGGNTRGEWLVWHALLHDIGKPITRSEEIAADGGVRYRFFDHENVGATMAVERLTALRFSRQEVTLARRVIQAHMRPHHLHASFGSKPISRRALYRFIRDTGGPVDGPYAVDVALLALADLQATYSSEPPDWAAYVQHIAQIIAYAFDDHGEQDVRRRPLVDGHAIMSHLDMQPGPEVGRLLDRLLEAQAAGDIENVEQALALADQLKQALEP